MISYELIILLIGASVRITVHTEALSTQVCCCHQSQLYSKHLIFIVFVTQTRRRKSGTAESWCLVRTMSVQYWKPRHGVIDLGSKWGEPWNKRKIMTDVHTDVNESVNTEPASSKPDGSNSDRKIQPVGVSCVQKHTQKSFSTRTTHHFKQECNKPMTRSTRLLKWSIMKWPKRDTTATDA